MKDRYVAPKIVIESFKLSQSIARPCGDNHEGTLGESTHYNESTCQWIMNDEVIFFSSTPCADWATYFDEEDNAENMEENYGDNFDINGVCYNNPTGVQTIFSST